MGLWEERPIIWATACATLCTSASAKRCGSEVSVVVDLGTSGGIIPEFVLPPVEVPEGGAGSETELGVAGFVAESVDVTGVVMMNQMGYEHGQSNHTTFAATQLHQQRNCLCLISRVDMCYILGGLRGCVSHGKGN